MSIKVMQQRIIDYFNTQPILKAWLFEHRGTVK